MQLSKRPDPYDQALFVEFHDEAKPNPKAGLDPEAPAFIDVPYVRITVDPFTVNDAPVRDDEEYSDIRRFPDAYEIYRAKRTGERVGTPLKMMTGMTPAKIKNYEQMDIYSVEQLSLQADQTVSKIMGGLADRKEAIKFLELTKDDAKNAQLEKKFEAIQVQLDSQKDALEEKDRIIAELLKEKEKLKKGKSDEK